MTWVVGMPTPFGAAIAISDVRVTWSDGTSADCLRKVYPVHQNMACGISGSVELGFRMLDDLARCLSPIPAGRVPLPAVTTWRWWRRARRIYASAPEEQKRGRCSLMILGVSAIANESPWPRSYVAVLRAPSFRPEFQRGFDWCASIGSGGGVEEYRKAIEGRNFDLLQAAVGSNRPGFGIAQYLATRLQHTVKARRDRGVSEHLQVTGVDPNGGWMHDFELGEFGPDGVVFPDVPQVATGYAEFRAIAKQYGKAADLATATARTDTSPRP